MLENTPWPSRRVELSIKKKGNQRAQKTETHETCDSAATTSANASPSSPPPPSTGAFPVELRWGAPVKDLRAIWALHELCFPLSYAEEYYRWLTEPTCLCLTAYTTREALARLKRRHDKMTGRSHSNGDHPQGNSGIDSAADEDDDDDDDAASDSSIHEVSSTIAAAEARTRGDYLIHAPEEAERDVRTMTSVDLLITELEYQDERDTKAAASPASPSPTTAEALPVCSEVLGFACAQIVFAGDDRSYLFTNPTGYLGTLAVLPAARCLGIGAELLRSLLHFMTDCLPLRASHYLHYDEAEMRKMAWRVMGKEAVGNSGDSGEGQAGEKAPAVQGEYGFWETLCQLFFPAAAAWMERCSMKRQLVAGGMSPKAADAEVARRIAEAAAAAEGRTAEDEAQENFFNSLTPERRQELLDPVVQVGVREVWLHCMAADGPLKRFYQRNGFSVAIAALENYYEFGGGSHDASLLLYVKPDRTPAESDTNNSVYAADELDLAALAERRQRERLTQHHHVADPVGKATEVVTEKKDAPTLRRRRKASPPDSKTADTVETESDDEKGKTSAESNGSATAAASAESPSTGSARPGSGAQWLSAATYDSVTHISITTVESARSQWRELRDRRRAARRKRLEQLRPASWRDNMQDIAFTLNGLLCLVAVCYFAYHYGVV